MSNMTFPCVNTIQLGRSPFNSSPQCKKALYVIISIELTKTTNTCSLTAVYFPSGPGGPTHTSLTDFSPCRLEILFSVGLHIVDPCVTHAWPMWHIVDPCWCVHLCLGFVDTVSWFRCKKTNRKTDNMKYHNPFSAARIDLLMDWLLAWTFTFTF